jgi:hypothetical protein
MRQPRRIAIDGTHGRLAWCDLLMSPAGEPDAADVRIHVESGHLEPPVRRELLAEVAAEAHRLGLTRVYFTAPLGDSELLALLRNGPFGGPVKLQAAGSTCLIQVALN